MVPSTEQKTWAVYFFIHGGEIFNENNSKVVSGNLNFSNFLRPPSLDKASRRLRLDNVLKTVKERNQGGLFIISHQNDKKLTLCDSSTLVW